MEFRVKLLFLFAFCYCNAEWVNQNVDRSVDLKSHVPKFTETVVLKNAGTSPASSFEYTADKSMKRVLAFIEFKSGGDILPFTTKQSKSPSGSPIDVFTVKLSKGVKSSETVRVVVTSKYSHALKPFPAEIEQGDKQLVLFEGNLYYFSPYTTENQKMVVTLASTKIESTVPKPTLSSEAKLTYGPYSDISKYNDASMSVHFGNNNPFLVITHMTRTIEVSHWGNIAVEETYEVVHMGARLSGSFSRYDYQHQRPDTETPSVKDFTTVLPASAQDVYYRDEIGNISTSHMRVREEAVELVIRPRFPLFGGWKTQYTIGYNIPSYQFLYFRGSDFALRMPFVDHVFDNQVVDEFELRVTLPEGSVVADMMTPAGTERRSDEKAYTYLDTNSVGRPVVVVTGRNLVDSHIQDFQLDYSFSSILLIREPAMMVGVLFALFAAMMVCARLDLSIATDKAGDAKLRAATHVAKAVDLARERGDLYARYNAAVAQLKLKKSVPAFSAERKQLDAERKAGEAEMVKTVAALKEEGAEDAEKVAEVVRLGEQEMGIVSEEIQNAERLLSGKMSKGDYVSKAEALDSKKIEIEAKVGKLLMAL